MSRNLKWHNERNPCHVLHVSRGTADFKSEEGGGDVRYAWPLCPGRHTCYNAGYKGMRSREAEPIPKDQPSSDWRLKLVSMKAESLVIAGQLYRGEYVLGPCTHCPSGQESHFYPKLYFGGVRVGMMIRAKS